MKRNTELSKYVSELKEKDIIYFINCNIDMKLHKYVCGSRKCDTCICEELLISRADPNVCLINAMRLSQNAGVEIDLR